MSHQIAVARRTALMIGGAAILAPAIQAGMQVGLPSRRRIRSLRDVLTARELEDVLTRSNTIDLTAKIAALIADAPDGSVIDCSMLKGVVTLTDEIFPYGSRDVRLLFSGVHLRKDFNRGPLRLPSNLTLETLKPSTISSSADLDKVGATAAPASGMLMTSVTGAPASGRAGSRSVALDYGGAYAVPGALISIAGLQPDESIQHVFAEAFTSSTPHTIALSPNPAQTLGAGFRGYVQLDTETIRIALNGSSATIEERGALGTQAVAHRANSTGTLLTAFVSEIREVSGNFLTLADPVPRSFVGATCVLGSNNCAVVGPWRIDGGFREGDRGGTWSCITAEASQRLQIGGGVYLSGGSHGGLTLIASRLAEIDLEEIRHCGRPNSELGAALWLFARACDNKVRVAAIRDCYLGVAIDNKSSSVGAHGHEGPSSRNIVEVDAIHGTNVDFDITGSDNNTLWIGVSDAPLPSYIVHSGYQNITAVPARGNSVEIRSERTTRDHIIDSGNTLSVAGRSYLRRRAPTPT